MRLSQQPPRMHRACSRIGGCPKAGNKAGNKMLSGDASKFERCGALKKEGGFQKHVAASWLLGRRKKRKRRLRRRDKAAHHQGVLIVRGCPL